MTFKCVCCQRVQFIGYGRPLPSGSWICTDLDDCARHLADGGTDG